MTPLGFSGGSHDRLSVSEVERIRWTVGTAEGAVGGHQREQYIITLVLEVCSYPSWRVLTVSCQDFSSSEVTNHPSKIIIIQNSST